ncbi:CENP-Q, a CENPA-CAD centromere complex subunit domain-containing protein [Trichoderma novae-zelandiae]
MAPEPSVPRRKRGRPSNASKLEIDASRERNDATEAYDTDAPDQMRPKKRGRPRKNPESPGGGVSPTPESSKPARRRGRPSLGGRAKDADREAVSRDEATPTQQKRKRGRPSLKGRGVEDAESQTSSQSNSGAQESEEDQLQNKPPSHTEMPVKRKRGRPSLQARREEEEAALERDSTKTTQQAQPRRRGRPSLRDISAPNGIQSKPSDATKRTAADSPSQAASGKRRGRPPGSGRVSAGAAAEESPAPSARRPPEAESEPAADAHTPKKKQRRPRQDAGPEEDDDDLPPSPEKPYPHVSPHVRRIRQSTIESKWSPLPEPTISAASSMLALAHRPILQRLSNTEQRYNHTSAALRLVTHRITRKIARGIPFPPASMPSARAPRGRQAGAAPVPAAVSDGRATELDFESVLDAKQALERQLDPALHAVELLEREKQKLERELERDYEALRNLESSAKAQGREYRGLLKKAHVLAPTPEVVLSQRKQIAEQGVSFSHSEGSLPGGLFSDLEDPELKALALQLSDHMESIKTNLQQADGIVPQLARSRAALQDVLFRHLSQEQYERVVLG